MTPDDARAELDRRGAIAALSEGPVGIVDLWLLRDALERYAETSGDRNGVEERPLVADYALRWSPWRPVRKGGARRALDIPNGTLHLVEATRGDPIATLRVLDIIEGEIDRLAASERAEDRGAHE